MQMRDALEGGGVGRVAQTHPSHHPGTLGGNGFDDGRKACIKQDHPVFGVVDDVDQLIGVQSGIAGVHHHATAGHGVIGL